MDTSPQTQRDTFLRRAIALAATAASEGQPPFGSLLVSADGQVLAEDHNTVPADDDITAHPELKLARWAGAHLDAETAATTTMYTSCQPCGMCAGAIERSGLGAVVYALSAAQLRRITEPAGGTGPTPRVRSDGPHLEDEATAVVAAHYRRTG